MPPQRPEETPPHLPNAAALLQAVAVPLLHVDAHGVVRWANAAAQQALGATPGVASAALWRNAAPPAQGQPPPPLQAAHDGRHYRLSTTPLPEGGSLWTLEGAEDLQEARAELQHQHELMDLVREFGRLGVWERDVRSLQGR